MTPLLWLVFALVVLATFLALGWWWSVGIGSRRARGRSYRAQSGEVAAEQLLSDHGYKVLDRQVRCLWWIEVDGEETEVALRADLVVERQGKRFVAEVKTGELAPDPNYPPTRRQLLEYSLAFAPMGVLLVDVEQGDIRQVRFPRVAARSDGGAE